MSVLGKHWKINDDDETLSILEKLKKNRPVHQEKELVELHDPFLFSDMAKAVARIEKAIENGERIMIFGDYDVDGITSSAILIQALKKINAKVSCRLPNRVTDGYGLSEKFIDEFIEKEIGLIITVDCGISCISQIKKANENGIDTIITDHHKIPEKIPEALAILHPKICNNYPCKELTGAGVALKLAQALAEKHIKDDEREDVLARFLELACLGTVSDLGVLAGENRLIVKKGLDHLKDTNIAGLQKLKESAKIEHNTSLNTMNIGFGLAPRINAAGRIGDPYKALFLLLQKHDHEKAKELADELETLNITRREMTEKSIEEINEVLKDSSLPAIIIESSPDWHVGILGLIAGKIVEKTNRPAMIMQDLGDHYVASARSPEYFNVIEAITKFKDLLMGFGGHPQAAGLSIKKENYEEFKKLISEYTEKKLLEINQRPLIEIDCELSESDLTLDLLDEIEQLEPFGIGNKQPIFMMTKVFVDKIGQVGAKKNHLKFSVHDINAIAFGMGKYREIISDQSALDIVFQLSRNTWNGRENLSIQILDFKDSKE